MPVIRPIPLTLGALVLAAAWLTPLPALARGSFAAHMSMHMAVVAIAAPLLAVAVAQTRFDPARLRPGVFAPIPASVVELVVVWAWHVPALHHAARANTAMLVGEQAMFLISGLLLWLSAVGGADAVRMSRRAAGVAGLLFTSMHMTLLGALFALSPRPLYAHLSHGAFELTPLADQHLGGVIMLLVGGASYLAGGVWLTAHVLREPAVEVP